MILSPRFIKDFPKLSDWIVLRSPAVKGNVKVFRAFQRRALRPGNPPEIERRHIAPANGEYLAVPGHGVHRDLHLRALRTQAR